MLFLIIKWIVFITSFSAYEKNFIGKVLIVQESYFIIIKLCYLLLENNSIMDLRSLK